MEQGIDDVVPSRIKFPEIIINRIAQDPDRLKCEPSLRCENVNDIFQAQGPDGSIIDDKTLIVPVGELIIERISIYRKCQSEYQAYRDKKKLSVAQGRM
jgi:hypothetical protein